MIEQTSKNSRLPALGQLIFLLAWLGLIMWLATLDTGAQTEEIKALMSPGFMRGGLFIQAILIFFIPVVFSLFIIRREKISYLQFGRDIHSIWFLIAAGLMLAAIPAVSWLGEVNAEMHLPASMQRLESWMRDKEIQNAAATEVLLNDKSIMGLIMNLITIALTAAVSEEIFFRGMLQKSFQENGINKHLAVWLSAILFSAIHIQFFGFFPRLFLGVLLGYIFLFTGKLWLSILAHFVNNALVVILAFMAAEEIKINPLEKSKNALNPSMPWPLVIVSFMCVLGILYYLWKKNRGLRIVQQ